MRRARKRKGAALVEYAILIAGVAAVALAGVAIFGHKVSDMINMTATVLPGAHAEGNAPISSGKLVETEQENGVINLDTSGITDNSNTERLTQNLWGVDAGEQLVPEP